MKEDKAKEYSSLGDLFAGEKADIRRYCDLCGECLVDCPVFSLTSFSKESRGDIQQKVLDALEGRPSDIARELCYACVRCAGCINSCPQGLNPYHLQEILKAELVTCDYTLPAVKPKLNDRLYDLQDMVQYLQIKPSQMDWLTAVPAQPEQKDVVVFLGCSNRPMPDKNSAVTGLLAAMGIDFVALGGGALCCGGRDLRKGDLTGADKAARELLKTLNSYQPKRVAFTCGTCLYEVGKVFPRFDDVPFQTVHISKLLADEVQRLKFHKPVEARIAVHDPCNLSRKGGDVASVRKLLSAVPGVTLVEMAHNKENSLCCGVTAVDNFPEIATALRQRALDEASDTGADILATACTGCHRTFCRDQKDYPFEITHFINLVAEAAGLSYEDKLKKFLQIGTIDGIINESLEYIEASPYTIEEYRQLLPLYFNFPEPLATG